MAFDNKSAGQDSSGRLHTAMFIVDKEGQCLQWWNAKNERMCPIISTIHNREPMYGMGCKYEQWEDS